MFKKPSTIAKGTRHKGSCESKLSQIFCLFIVAFFSGNDKHLKPVCDYYFYQCVTVITAMNAVKYIYKQ